MWAWKWQHIIVSSSLHTLDARDLDNFQNNFFVQTFFFKHFKFVFVQNEQKVYNKQIGWGGERCATCNYFFVLEIFSHIYIFRQIWEFISSPKGAHTGDHSLLYLFPKWYHLSKNIKWKSTKGFKKTIFFADLRRRKLEF